MVQGTADDKVVGVGWGTCLSPRRQKLGYVRQELEDNIFDYGVPNAADLMCTSQEKIRQYVGIKYGEDIANKLTNKDMVTIPPPVYSTAVLLRH